MLTRMILTVALGFCFSTSVLADQQAVDPYAGYLAGDAKHLEKVSSRPTGRIIKAKPLVNKTVKEKPQATVTRSSREVTSPVSVAAPAAVRSAARITPVVINPGVTTTTLANTTTHAVRNTATSGYTHVGVSHYYPSTYHYYPRSYSYYSSCAPRYYPSYNYSYHRYPRHHSHWSASYHKHHKRHSYGIHIGSRHSGFSYGYHSGKWGIGVRLCR